MRFVAMILAFALGLGAIIGIGWYLSPAGQMKAAVESAPNYDEEGDFYARNPFLLEETMTPGAVAKVDNPEFDFDKMALGEKGQHDYIIKNTGTVPLKIAKGRAQCKCTLASLKNAEIPPGGEAAIQLEYEPKSGGPFSQEAIIFTSDPKNPELHLVVKGNMLERIVISPADGWSLGSVNKEPVDFEGFVYSQIVDDLTFTEIIPSSDLITLEVLPIEKNESPGPESKSAYRLIGRLNPPEGAGPINESIVLKTNQPGDEAEFKLNLTAFRQGPVTIVGSGWFASRSIFSLENISSEKGRTFRYTLLLQEENADIEITEVTSDPEFLEVSLKRDTSSENSSRFILELRVPPNSPPGIWSGDNMGQLNIKTTHPLLSKMQFQVQLEIR